MRTSCDLLPGPPLLGFALIFDEAYGKPSLLSYPRVTPSRIGDILLPFPCVHCGAVRSETINPKKRDGYRDKYRGFSFCPSCQGRYILNLAGTPLTKELPPGAFFAPAHVEGIGMVGKHVTAPKPASIIGDLGLLGVF